MSDLVLMLIMGSEMDGRMAVLRITEGLTFDIGCWLDAYATSVSDIETD